MNCCYKWNMEANIPRPTRPSAFSDAPITNGLALAASIVCLFYLWTLNYNKLGSFYDYSIMADAAGKFAAGLRPFRDFVSPLQSLPIWLAHACELLFGPRYLALAYGNLLLTLGLFFIVVHYARKGFSFPSAILIGMAVVVASSLQHGIIWYNSIALLLLSAISLKCADLLRSQAIRPRDACMVAALLLLIGMTKMNFYLVAICMVACFAFARAISGPRFENKKNIAGMCALAVAVCCAPPLIESFANHVALASWLRQVILLPASTRTGTLAIALNPTFYFQEQNPWYPGTVLRGAVLFCFAIYGFLAYSVEERFRADQHRDVKGLIVRIGMICLFWGATLILVLSNVEIESLCLCFCLVGVAGMRISGQFPGEKWEKALQISAMVLAAYFLLVGGLSLARHSRISYAANVFPGDTIANNGEPSYLRGVELSRQASIKLASISAVLKNNNRVPVYWGPGFEAMNRIHGGVTDPAFPLWYHRLVTWHDSNIHGIIDAIERSGAGLFVADPFWFDNDSVFPMGVKSYLDRDWVLIERSDSLVVYRKKGPWQNSPSRDFN